MLKQFSCFWCFGWITSVYLHVLKETLKSTVPSVSSATGWKTGQAGGFLGRGRMWRREICLCDGSRRYFGDLHLKLAGWRMVWRRDQYVDERASGQVSGGGSLCQTLGWSPSGRFPAVGCGVALCPINSNNNGHLPGTLQPLTGSAWLMCAH